MLDTIKVDANAGNVYLANLEELWLPGVVAAKELGHIEDYLILSSDLPNSGDFNLILAMKVKSTADMAPSEARFKALNKKLGENREDRAQTTKRALTDYPEIRKITGSYMMRELTFK